MSSPTTSGPKIGKFQKWHRLILSVCFVALAGELGLCLVALPWMSNWEMSYIPMHNPALSDLWMSPYFRGALSGLGILDLYVALAETGRLFRVWSGRTS